MKRLLLLSMIALVTTPAGFAREQSILARITVYWPSTAAPERASSNGTKLRNGHCAVDPSKIPYGSKVVFPDVTCLAIDSGPAVVSRTAARRSARTALQRAALVIDRFFESKTQALAWAATHPHFMTVQVTDKNPASSSLTGRVGPVDALKADNQQSSLLKPNDYTQNSASAPAEVGGPLLLTPSGTALPRS